MRRYGVALSCATVAISFVLVGLPGIRYCQARAEATEERSRLALVSRQTSELSALRSSAPSWTLRPRPATGLTPRIGAALSAAGLPASAISSLSPESESPVGDADLKARRTRAVLTLASVTLPQLGSFLKSWRSLEPHWVVSSLDLSLEAGHAKAQETGGDLPLRVVIGLETLFVDRPEPAPQAQGFVDQKGGPP